jgi:hypothetical protein
MPCLRKLSPVNVDLDVADSSAPRPRHHHGEPQASKLAEDSAWQEREWPSRARQFSTPLSLNSGGDYTFRIAAYQPPLHGFHEMGDSYRHF